MQKALHTYEPGLKEVLSNRLRKVNKDENSVSVPYLGQLNLEGLENRSKTATKFNSFLFGSGNCWIESGIRPKLRRFYSNIFLKMISIHIKPLQICQILAMANMISREAP